MARSGIFNLVSRDDRFREICQEELISRRLKKIRSDRLAKNARIMGEYEAVQRAAPRGVEIPRPKLSLATPTFADVAKSHILYVREAYEPHVPITSEYVKVSPNSNTVRLDSSTSQRREFTLPSMGHFLSDMVFHVTLPEIGRSGGSTYYRWASYPGLRLFKNVSIQSSGTELDSYDSEDAVFYGQMKVPPQRRPAWERMVGQEETRTATYFNRNGWTGELNYRDGLQTPRKVHEATDLWVPLQFWMCDGVESALASSMIPASERKIVVDFDVLSRLVSASDGCDTARTLDLTNVEIRVDLYVNTLFTLPEVAQIFQERIGMSLVRVHRKHTQTLSANTGDVLLSDLKWPIEYAVGGVRDDANEDSADYWHLMGRARTRARAQYLTLPVLYYNGTEDQLVARDAVEVTALDPIVSKAGITVEDSTKIYDLQPASFYNAYLPGRYPTETGISAPTDPNLFLFPFCLWPNQRKQTGSLDASAMKRITFNYEASGISSSSKAKLIVRCIAINFLATRGDRCHLRYGM